MIWLWCYLMIGMVVYVYGRSGVSQKYQLYEEIGVAVLLVTAWPLFLLLAVSRD